MQKKIEEMSQRLYDITSESCKKNCKHHGECCDDLFCSRTEILLKKMGKAYKKPNYNGIRYMSENGCVVPPKHRPLCSGFGCGDCLNGIKISFDKYLELNWDLKYAMYEYMKDE